MLTHASVTRHVVCTTLPHLVRLTVPGAKKQTTEADHSLWVSAYQHFLSCAFQGFVHISVEGPGQAAKLAFNRVSLLAFLFLWPIASDERDQQPFDMCDSEQLQRLFGCFHNLRGRRAK